MTILTCIKESYWDGCANMRLVASLIELLVVKKFRLDGLPILLEGTGMLMPAEKGAAFVGFVFP